MMADQTEQAPPPKWRIMWRPEGKNGEVGSAEAKNGGGLAIYLVPVDRSNVDLGKQEVSRVAFVRRNSKNPSVSLEAKLAEEVNKARVALKILNEQFDGTGELL
jgi:hypothetical protein